MTIRSSWARLPLLVLVLAVGCSQSEAGPSDDTVTTTSSTAVDESVEDAAEEPEGTTTTLALKSAELDELLPVVCDFERYNGLRVKKNATDANPAGYEQVLDNFVRVVLDRSLPTDQASLDLIAEEQARCAALPNLTFANGSHPVGAQIEATTFRSVVPVQQDCWWQRTDADGDVVETVSVEAGSIVEIVVDPSDRTIRIDGCGIFVAGTPPVER